MRFQISYRNVKEPAFKRLAGLENGDPALRPLNSTERSAGPHRAPVGATYDGSGWITWTVITSVPWYCWCCTDEA